MQGLLEALQTIKRPGSFSAEGTIDPCFPGLEVTGIGLIGLPLSKTQAEQVIKRCSQAPFGRGEQTIVDTNVRRVWQLDPQHFKINNTEWETKITALVEGVKNQLGLGESSVSYDLYKLLIYEKGSFFVSHRDTEKQQNMFATLVVVFPSEHEGGELIIRHDGQEKIIDFANKNNRYKIQYAAFYADCEHEIKPVTNGYRLSLIYNLVLSDTKQQPLAPKTSKHVETFAQILNSWALKDQSTKMTLLLEHQYIPAGLSFHGLKNIDRVKAETLVRAAAQANCEAFLALLTLWEAGSANGGGYYGYDMDEDDYEMDEVHDRTLSLDHWRAPDGSERDFGIIGIDEDEIVSENPLEDDEPDRREV